MSASLILYLEDTLGANRAKNGRVFLSEVVRSSISHERGEGYLAASTACAQKHIAVSEKEHPTGTIGDW